MSEKISDEELKEMLCSGQFDLDDVIRCVVELNHLIGVGVMSLERMILNRLCHHTKGVDNFEQLVESYVKAIESYRNSETDSV